MRDLEIHRGLPEEFSWEGVFGNRNPVEIEIGFGKARFLLKSASGRPEVNFLGVELSRKWYRDGKRRIEKAGGMTNLRVMNAEVVDFFQRFVPGGSVEVVHAYYPDPWPKKRHLKRRFVDHPFLRECERILPLGGELRIVTDSGDYAEWIGQRLADHPLLQPLPWEQVFEEGLTHYEIKYRKEGRRVHHFRLRKEAG